MLTSTKCDEGILQGPCCSLDLKQKMEYLTIDTEEKRAKN